MRGVNRLGVSKVWLGTQGELCIKCSRSYTKDNLSLLLRQLKVNVSKVRKVNVLNRSSRGKSVIGKKTKAIGYKLFRIRLSKDARFE